MMLLLTLVFCVDSTLCECGWAVTLPTGIACLPHTHNSVRMMMKVMRMVRMVLIRMVNHHWWGCWWCWLLSSWRITHGVMRSSREEMGDDDGVDVGGNNDDEEKKLWLTLRLRVEFAYEPDLPEKLKFQQSCPTLLQHHHANNYCNPYHRHACNCHNGNVNYDNIMVMIIMINTMTIMEL